MMWTGRQTLTCTGRLCRELAALTATFFKQQQAATGGTGDAATPGATGAAAPGGTSSSSSRKARVFKLGDFQLKQLRNGDVYKVGRKRLVFLCRYVADLHADCIWPRQRSVQCCHTNGSWPHAKPC